jgi:hypothetical protein
MESKILPKHDEIFKKTYRPRERLPRQHRQIESMDIMPSILKARLLNASDSLTDKQLNIIANAVENAYNAVSNAAHLGESGYESKPVKKITWEV